MAQRTTLGIRTIVTLIAIVLCLSVSIQAQQVLPLPAAPGEANQTEFRGSGVVEQTVPRASGPRDTQLLQNGGFEAAGATSKLAANWTGIRLLEKSRRACNRIDHPTKPNKIVAHEGSCAFQFFAQITNVTRQLKQVATPIAITNDVLDLSYWAEGKDVDGNPRVQVVVKYNDNTKEKLVVPAQTGTFAYTQFTGSMVLDKPVTKIIVKLIADDGGRLYFDDVSLMHSPFEFAPTASDDSFAVSVGTVNVSNSVTTNDNLANPPATVTNYANPGDIGGGSTVASPGLYTIPGSGGITVGIAANGTMTVDSQTSGTALTGVYTFEYQLSNIAGSDTAMVTLNVQVGPIAQDDSFTVLVGNSLSSDLNDNNGSGADSLGVPPGTLTSFGGGALGGTVITNTAPAMVGLAGGSLSVNADGTISLSGTTQTGIFTFEYRLSNAAASDDATVTIEIRRAPTANNDGTYAVNIGGTLTITTADSNDLLDNDDRGFPLADIASFGGGSLPGDASTVGTPGSIALAGGTLQANIDGSFSLTTPTTAGTYTFNYRLSNVVAMDDAAVTIEVRQVPDAQDDSFDVLVGATLTGDLNDSNGSGADDLGFPTTTLTSFGGGSLGGSVTSNLAGASVGLAGGTLTVNADGTLSLSGTNQTGIFTFSYRLTNAGGTDDAVVTIEIRKAPTASDDGTYLVGTGQTLTILTADANDLLDNDDRGFPLATIASFGGGSLAGDASANAAGASIALAGGTLQVNADGSFSLTTPITPGNYTFLYRLSNVANFDDATVNIQVQQSPVAEDDSFNMLVTATLNGDLTANNGSGADNPGVPAYNSLTFGGGDAGGTITTNTAPASVTLAGGTLQVNADGSFSLTTPNQTGVFTFQYRLSNTIPATDDATVTIEIRKAPTANDDGTYLIGTGQTLNVLTTDGNDLLDNDDRGYPLANIASFGGGSLAGHAGTNSAPGSIALAGGTLQVNTDGSFSLTTPTVAGTYTFLYRLTNAIASDDAQVTIQVQQSPVAEDDSFTMLLNGTLNGDLVTDDNGSGADHPGVPPYNVLSFGGGSLTGDATTNMAPASLPLAGGTLTVNFDGTFSLVNPTVTGAFTFQYRLFSSAIPAFDDATVTINVSAFPDAENDTNLFALYGDNTTFSAGTLFANNGFGEDLMGVPAGTITFFGGGSIPSSTQVTDFAANASATFANGTLTVNSDGSFSVNNPTLTGDFTFLYRLENASGFDDATVTVTIRRAPAAQADAFTFDYAADQTTPNSLFLDNGFGADQLGFPAATLVSFGGGALTGTVDSFTTPQPLADGTLTVNSDGSWSLVGQPFTPGVYTFDYRITNAVGSSVASVTLNIVQTPTAVDDLTFVVASGSTLNIDVPQSILNNDDLGFPLADVESYGGGDAGGTVTTYLANTSVNPIPIYTDGVLQINAVGTGVFTPPTTPTPFCGEFDFQYRLSNTIPAFDDAAVIVTVTCLPVANDDSFVVLVGAPLNGDLNDANAGTADFLGFPAGAISSFGGGALGGSVTSFTTPQSLAGGALTVNADGTFSLTGTTTPGSYTFSYRLSNSIPASDDATVTIEVRQAPIANDDLTYVATSGVTLNVPAGTGLLANDTRGFPLANVASFGGGDAGGSVTSTAAGLVDNTLPVLGNGVLVVNADGSFSFTPPTTPARFCGVFDFEYRLTNVVASDDGAVQITVSCAPIANDDTFNGSYTSGVNGVGKTGDLNDANGGLTDDLGVPTATLTNFGGGSLGATNAPGATVAFAGGTITIDADGTFTLADADTPGVHTFTYTLTNSGGSDDALVTFVIDDAPTVTLPTSPANGAINVQPSSNIMINFSENVNIASGGVTLQCPISTNITFAPVLPLLNTNTITVNPTADLPGNTLCTVTVVAADVSDTDANDAPNLLDGNDDNIEGDNYVFTFTTAPVANDDSYTVTPQLTYDSAIAAFSVRNNDDPADLTAITGFGTDLASANGTVPNGTNSITAGGAGGRVILRANGTFLFYPDAGDSNVAATFFYTITGGDTAQVTLNIQNQELVWFVDDIAGSNCTGANVGTQACPATGAAALSTVAGMDTANDTIYIAASSAFTCGITLEQNEKVIGDGAVSVSLQTFSGVTPVTGSSLPTTPASAADPTLSTTAASTNCFNLVAGSPGSTGNTLRGLTIGDTTGYGIAATANLGTATVSEVSDIGTGGFFRITGGGTFNASYNDLTSTSFGDSVVFWAVGGGMVTNASGSISHAAAGFPTIDFSGGNLSWTYTGSITKTAGGRVFEIEDTFGALSFPGTITQNVAAGTGVFIDDQVGGSISFGTLNLGSSGTRMTSTAITATDGNSSSTVNLGTVSLFTTGTTAVTITNNDGTVNSTAGTVNAASGQALNIDGPGGLTTLGITLTSVSASGGANGVFIQDTDGSFTVVGTGASNSGGIIQSTSGSDLAVAGNGVYLNNADNVSLAWMRINDHANNGIFGIGVRGLMLDRMLFNGNNGASNFGPYNESSIHLRDLGGDVSITNSNITGGGYNQVFIDNSTGSAPVLDLTFTSNDLGFLQGSTADVRGSALRLNIADGSADMRIEDNDITYWWGNAIQLQVQTGASASTARIRDNRVLQTSGALAGAGGIWVNGGNLTFDISNNTVAFTNGTAISVDKAIGNTYLNGTVHNNQIGYAAASAGPGGTPPQGGSWPSNINSGSAAGMGIYVSHIGVNTTTVLVSNNTIRQTNGTQAIWALVGDDVAGGGAGTLNVTIVGNNIAEEGSAAGNRHGIVIQSGRVTGDTDQMCADVGGAGGLANAIVNFNTRIRPNHRFNTTMRLPGYTGGPTDTAAVNSYLAARNPGTIVVTAATAGSGGIFNTAPAGSACPQPTLLD